MKCTVVTPDKTVVDQEALFVVVPLWDGEYGILPGHAPIVGRLGAGELRIQLLDKTTESYFVSDGFVEVLNDHVILMTIKALPTEDIDSDEVQRELDELMSKTATTMHHVELRDEMLASFRAELRLAKKS